MKFKAIQEVIFPKFNISVQEDNIFDLTAEQLEEVKHFENVRFKALEVKQEIKKVSKESKDNKKSK